MNGPGLVGKTALVTGSGTGIGKAIAKKFAALGANVIILGRRKAPLEETAAVLEDIAEDVNSGAFVRMFDGTDVADADAITRMFRQLQNESIKLDYIINNAGVSGPVTCFANAGLDDFKSTIDIHLTGTFWVSVSSLPLLNPGGKIITISTFFTEERPLEQRPYRFRSPYTASQGAKNRLAEAMSWELADRDIISIATNPGPVHSDRIYKTVYPKAASEFMRVSGFEDLAPDQVAQATRDILPLLGEDENVVRTGISRAADSIVKKTGGDTAHVSATLTNLLNKIQNIAEKIQKNTSHMIANREFLSQSQVATAVINLCDHDTARMLNGKVIPGDRVFYPVRAHVANSAPSVHAPDLSGKGIVFVVDATDDAGISRLMHLASEMQKSGGQVACFISNTMQPDLANVISSQIHSHVIDIRNSSEVSRWLATASSKLGPIEAVIYLTGNLPELGCLVDLPRNTWDGLVEKFITGPATVAQQALEMFVPGGGEDPRKYRDARGRMVIIGPDLPVGKKISGVRRAQIEVFRGALRPFTTTVNQEFSEVLKSDVRLFTLFAGSVSGAEPDNDRMADAVNFALSSAAVSSSAVTFCVDETR